MKLGRRELCLGLGGLAVLSGCGACQGAPQAQAPVPGGDAPSTLSYTVHGSGASTVVEARWAAAVDPSGKVDPIRVALMLEGALEKLTGSASPFKTWAHATQRIGIKVNAITSQAYTHPELAAALARGLVQAGSDPARVTVWDRDNEALRARGHTIDRTGQTVGFRCMGSDAASSAAKPQAVVAGGARVHLAPLLVESDQLINIAALKDHSMAGVTLSLKNNLGMIHGAELLHGDYFRGSGCEPGISDLAALPEIRGRLRLVVLDALVGVCQGGPGPAESEHVWRHAGLLVSLDPVALDRRGLAIIEARRVKLGLEPLGARAKPNPSPTFHIDHAADKLKT